jgi:hypothetical protein
MLPLRRKSKPERAPRGANAPRKSGPPNSLFGEILDWMLAPLLFLWPISIIVTHNVADSIANQPYDLALADGVRALARLVEVEDGHVVVRFPAPPRALFRADQDDVVYYQVADVNGVTVSGDAEIPPMPTSSAARRRGGAAARRHDPRRGGAHRLALRAPRSCAGRPLRARAGRRDAQQAHRPRLARGHRRAAAAVRHHPARGGAGVGGPDARHRAAQPAAGLHPSSSPHRPVADRALPACRRRCVRWSLPSTT